MQNNDNKTITTPESIKVSDVAPSKLRFYSPDQIAVATFFGGPVAGCWFIGRNYLIFGETGKASEATKVACLWPLFLPMLNFLPGDFFPKSVLNFLPIFFCLLFKAIAEGFQGPGIKEAKARGIVAGSNWKLVGISLCWLALTTSVFFALDIVRWKAGWKIYGVILGVATALIVLAARVPNRFHLIQRRASLALGGMVILVAAAVVYSYLTLPALLIPAAQGNINQVRELLDKGADVNARDILGDTPLTFPAFDGYTEVVKALVDKGADVNARNRLGATALQFASGKGHTDVVELLIDKNADVNIKDNEGNSALRYAADKGYAEIVKLLLDKGADFNAKDNDNNTPLTGAAQDGHTEVVRLLLDKGADIEIKDGDGDTALMDAADKGQISTVQLLLEKGADIGVRDKNGETALTLAEKSRHMDVVNLLRNYQKK